jgi:hypothetical protein
MWIVRQGATDDLWKAADLHLEDGSVVEGVKALPPDLPLGYHHLIPLDGWPSSQLVVAPARAHPVGERVWGWAAQLYAARSRASWGIGDLGDLARLARWSSSLGARVLVLNPLRSPRHPQRPTPTTTSRMEEPARPPDRDSARREPHRATNRPSRMPVALSEAHRSRRCSGSTSSVRPCLLMVVGARTPSGA